MTFGISIRDRNGQEYFSTRSSTWSFIGSFIASANENKTVRYEILRHANEVTIQRTFIESPPNSQEAVIHLCERHGEEIVAYGGNVNTLVVVLAR